MEPVTIRDDELAAVMDALSQYLDNAAQDDDGESIQTPEFLTVGRVLERVEAAMTARFPEV
jgi:hypothetical protein